MAQKKYVSIEKLGLYHEKEVARVNGLISTAKEKAIAHADSLASNYDSAGSAVTEAGKVQAELDKEVIRAKAREDEIAGLVATAQGEVDALELVVDGKAAQADLEALAGKVGEVPADQTVMGIIANIQENAYDDTEIVGRIEAVESSKADKTQVATDIAAAVKVEEDARKAAVEDVQGEVDALEQTHATDKKALEDAIALKADKTALDGVSETLAAVKEDVDHFFKDALGDTDAQQVKDTLKELQEYIASDESGAATMAGNIQANADAIDAVESRLDVVEPKVTTVEGKVSTLEGQMTTVQGAIATKVEQEAYNTKVGELEDADAGLDERLQVVEAKFGEGEGNVESQIATAKQEAITEAVAQAETKDAEILKQAKAYADTEVGKDRTRLDALEAIDHDHTNKALLDTYTQTEANLADAVAKKHEHSNLAVLEGITADKVTAWDKVTGKAEQTALQAEIDRATAKEAELQGAIDAFIECSAEEINAMFA